MSGIESIEFFTFATFGEDGRFRDYSEKYQALSENLAKFGIDVRLVSLSDLKDSLSTTQNTILKLNKGAGYWTWKPNVLEYALKNSTRDGVVYIDCDLIFYSDPTHTILSALKYGEVAAYRQDVFLPSNTSKKCLKYFGFTKNSKDYMWTASLIAMRRNNSNVSEFINRWALYCGNARLLVDPIRDFSRKHRHDQSIFSCLINSSRIEIFDLGEGFFSRGSENRSFKPTDILVSHGKVSAGSNKRKTPLKEWIAFLYFKLTFAKWILLRNKREK